MHTTIPLYPCALNDPPEYTSDPRKSSNPAFYSTPYLIVLGVQKVGEIVSDFDKDFDFGLKVVTTYSSRLKRSVSKFPHQVQVRFGDKGENLQFKNLVQGIAVSEAVIEFGKRCWMKELSLKLILA